MVPTSQMKLGKEGTRLTFVALAEQASKVLAVVAAALLTMSVCFDYGYLKALGLSFDDVPSLTAEHVRSAIVWAPTALLLLLGSVFSFLKLPFKSVLLEEDFISRSLRPVPKFTNWTDRVVASVVAAAVYWVLFFSTDFSWMYYLFIFLSVALQVFIARYTWLGINFIGKPWASFFFTLPGICALFGLLGHEAGTTMLSEASPKWELTIRTPPPMPLSKQAVTGLRRFSTFAITVDQARFVTVIPNDAILSARRLEILGPKINICRLSNVKCQQSTRANVVAPTPSKDR